MTVRQVEELTARVRAAIVAMLEAGQGVEAESLAV
jgi:hypothetical protein